MSHNWWHKDNGMTSQEAVAETRANVREEARQPSRPVPAPAPSRPDPHGGFNVPDPKPEPSRPEPRPSEPSDFFGSMYVTPKLPQAPPGQDPTGPHYGYGDLPHGGPGPALGTGDFEDDPYIPPKKPEKPDGGKTDIFTPVVVQILKGVQSTDRFFKKLASGKPLTTEDKIILANLIAANKKNPKVLGDLSKYLEEYDVSEEYLRGRLDREKEAFEG